MLPLVLVTGFLGAGKTSCLRHLIGAAEAQGRRLAVVVNEFAPADVDGERLELGADQLQSISGGSIFCHCRATTFIEVLGGLARRQDLDGILVEASGLADPAGVPRLLAEAQLDAALHLHRVLCLIDPGSFAKVRTTLPACERQVAIADELVVNHIDRHHDALLSATVEALARDWPEKALTLTSHGTLSADPFTAAASGLARDPRAVSAASDGFTQLVLPQLAPLPLATVTACLEPLRATCPRIKGTVATPEGPIRIDCTADTWFTAPGTPGDGARLVVIAPQAAAETVLAAARTLIAASRG